MGTAPQVQVLTRGWRATAGRRPALGHRLVGCDLWSLDFQRPATGPRPLITGSSNFFENFLFKKKDFLEVWVMG
jgi:hypothetical protein